MEDPQNEWSRWYVLRAAVENRDEDLARLILKPPNKSQPLPYMFKPHLLFEPPTWVLTSWQSARQGTPHCVCFV